MHESNWAHALIADERDPAVEAAMVIADRAIAIAKAQALTDDYELPFATWRAAIMQAIVMQ
jgi:hypothetical protein